jgi:hypothetical protein
MRSDIDQDDLYPPDEDDPKPARREHRKRAAIGTTLVVWGMSILIQRALGLDFDTFLLGIGIGALAGWSRVRNYRWFVVGAIATGIGLGNFAEAIAGPFASTLSSLAIAAGFAAVYVRYPRRSMWALVCAGIMALVGVAAFGIGLIGLIPAILGRFLLPLLLVSGGGLLLFRHSLPSRTVKIGLASVAGMFVLVGATSVGNVDHSPPVLEARGFREQSQDLVGLQGKTLVLHGGAGNVEFRTTTSEVGRIDVLDNGRARTGPFHLVIEREGNRVIVDAGSRKGLFGGLDDGDYVITLPEGVELDVERESGDISGDLRGASGIVRTASGDVELELLDGGAEGIGGDGPYDIKTESGDVDVESTMALELDLESDDGEVSVNGEAADGNDYRSPNGFDGVELDVDTESGKITVDARAAAPSTDGAEGVGGA